MQDIQNTINSYFDVNDNRADHFLKSVKRLSTQKISLKYPDQLKSRPILDNILQLRVKKSLALSAR